MTPITGLDFWQREATRHAQAADQCLTRGYTVLSFGIAGTVAIGVGSQVTRNALFLSAAPLVGIFAVGLVLLNLLRGLYASAWKGRAELELTRLLADSDITWSPRYGKDLEGRFRASGETVWTFGAIAASLVLTMVEGAAVAQNYFNWRDVRQDDGTVLMWIFVLLFFVGAFAIVIWAYKSIRAFEAFFEATPDLRGP